MCREIPGENKKKKLKDIVVVYMHVILCVQKDR